MLLKEDNNDLIDDVIKKFGVTETNILKSLSENQRKIWVEYAVLGYTKEEILERKYPENNRGIEVIDHALTCAMVKIISNVLSDVELTGYFSEHEGVKDRIDAMCQCILKTIRDMR